MHEVRLSASSTGMFEIIVMIKSYPKLANENLYLEIISSNDFDLGARQSAKFINETVLKKYQRGGFLTRFNTDIHIISQNSRAKNEFLMLNFLKENNVTVPETVAYMENNTFLFSKSYLITKRIFGKTFQAINNDIKAEEMILLAQEINKLINLKIWNPDLNPDNAILSADKVYLLDFDKTIVSEEALKAKYLTRWTRSIRKHNLSEKLDLTNYL